MSFRKVLDFIQEIGTIMYVGGILSHIVIGVVLGHQRICVSCAHDARVGGTGA